MMSRNQSELSIFRRVLRGIAAHGLFQGVQLFVRLAEVPLFLTFWGADGYGEWLMVAALPTVLTLSDGGFTKVTQREMAIRAGKGEFEGVNRAFQSGWLMLVTMSLVVLAALAVILPWVPMVQWLKLETVGQTSLTWALLLLSGQVCLSFQCALLYGGFAASGRYATGTLLQSISFLFGFVGTAIGVASGRGMAAAAAGSFGGWLVAWIVMRVGLARTGIPLGYGYKYASLLEVRRLFAPSIASLAFPAGEALNIQGMRLLVGLMFGPGVLSAFSALRTLCRAALQPVLSISRTLEPELSLAYGASDDVRIRQILLRGTQAALWLSLALCALMLLLGKSLFEGWTGGRLPFDWPAFLCLLASSLVAAVWCTSLALPVATNRHTKVAIAFILISGVAPIAFTYMLRPVADGLSPAIALLLSEILMAIFIVYTSARMASQPLLKLIFEVANPSIIATGYKTMRSAFFK